jgi:hypothetical protein
MTFVEGFRPTTLEVTDTISLHSPDGQEITITTKTIDGMHFVSVFVDDGINISTIEIPRFHFDQMMIHLRPLQ